MQPYLYSPCVFRAAPGNLLCQRVQHARLLEVVAWQRRRPVHARAVPLTTSSPVHSSPGLPAEYMAEAKDVFRNPSTTEFVIVTIPTAMAAAESIRLAKALKKEQVGRVVAMPGAAWERSSMGSCCAATAHWLHDAAARAAAC